MTIVAGGTVFYNLDYGTYGLPQAARHMPRGLCETLHYRRTHARMEGEALRKETAEPDESSTQATGLGFEELTTGAPEGLQPAEGPILRGQYGANALTQKCGQTHVLHMMALELHEDPDGMQKRVISHLTETTMDARTSAIRSRYSEESWESVRVSVEGSCWPGLSSAVKAVRDSGEPGLEEVQVEARFDFETSRRARLVWTIPCQGTKYSGDVQVALPKASYNKTKAAHTSGSHTDKDTCAGWEGVQGRGLVHKESEGSEVEAGPDVQ